MLAARGAVLGSPCPSIFKQVSWNNNKFEVLSLRRMSLLAAALQLLLCFSFVSIYTVSFRKVDIAYK